jgi:hypothetical protein
VSFIQALLQAFYVDWQDMLLGMRMDRNDAVAYLKELLSICDMSPSSVFFENPQDSDSEGYRVHIKGTIHESDRQKVRDIAKKRNLAVQEDDGGVVVFKPKDTALTF